LIPWYVFYSWFSRFSFITLSTTTNNISSYFRRSKKSFSVKLIDNVNKSKRKYILRNGGISTRLTKLLSQKQLHYIILTLEDPEGCISRDHNWDTNIGDTSLLHWLNDTSGYDIDIVDGKAKMIHYFKQHRYLDVYKENLCKNHFLKHGQVSPDEMQWIYKQNLGDC